MFSEPVTPWVMIIPRWEVDVLKFEVCFFNSSVAAEENETHAETSGAI